MSSSLNNWIFSLIFIKKTKCFSQSVVALLGLLANIICTCIIKVTGKRKLWLVSMTGSCLSCFGLGENHTNQKFVASWCIHQLYYRSEWFWICRNVRLQFYTIWMELVWQTWTHRCGWQFELHSNDFVFHVGIFLQCWSITSSMDSVEWSVSV